MCALDSVGATGDSSARNTREARVTVRPGHFFKTEPHVSMYRIVLLSYLMVTNIMRSYDEHFHINILSLIAVDIIFWRSFGSF